MKGLQGNAVLREKLNYKVFPKVHPMRFDTYKNSNFVRSPRRCRVFDNVQTGCDSGECAEVGCNRVSGSQESVNRGVHIRTVTQLGNHIGIFSRSLPIKHCLILEQIDHGGSDFSSLIEIRALYEKINENCRNCHICKITRQPRPTSMSKAIYLVDLRRCPCMGDDLGPW